MYGLKIALYITIFIGFISCRSAEQWRMHPAQLRTLATDMCAHHPYSTVALFCGSLIIINYLLEEQDEEGTDFSELTSSFWLKTVFFGALLDVGINREKSVPGNILWLIHQYNEKGIVQFFPWLTWHGIKKLFGY